MLNLVYPRIDIDGKRSATGIELFGTADLPDGTILHYDVHPAGLIGAQTGRRRGEVRVFSGRFAAAFEQSTWKATKLDVVLSLRADRNQPPETQALLGDHGQRMAADVVGHNHAEYFLTKTIELKPAVSGPS